MSSVWKNKTFSNAQTPETQETEDIYRDFNYKNIPPIYDNSPPSDLSVSAANSSKEPFFSPSPVIENIDPDTQSLDKNDNPDSNEISKKEVVIDSTEDNITTKQINDIFSKMSVLNIHDNDHEVRKYIDDVNAMTNEIKSKDQLLQGKNFTFDKMFEIISLGISFPSRILDRTISFFASLYLNYFNNMQLSQKLDKEKGEYKSLEEIVKLQMRNFMTVIIGGWIAVNWWWLFNYTYSYLSFAKLFNIPIIKIFMESLLSFLNAVNYCLLGFKQDDYRLAIPEYICDFLWKIRPIAFVAFYGMIQSIVTLHREAVNRQFMEAIARVSNPVSGINAAFFFFSFIKMDVLNPVRMMERVAVTQSFIVSIFLVIFKLLFVLAFLPFGVLFVYLYLVIYSFFGIFLFAGTNFFTAIQTMIMDLTNAVPDTNDTNESQIMTLWRIFMNTFIYVGISIIIIGILSSNLQLIQKLNQNNPTYTSMVVMSSLALFCGIIGSGINIWANLPKNYVKIAQNVI